MTMPGARTDAPDARTRIVVAGMRCIIREGIAESSMAAIAEEAAVSKALLHYHFSDRAHLLAAIVTAFGKRITARERAAIANGDDTAPVDALWRWVSNELTRGELQALLTIGTIHDTPVRNALAIVSRNRRDAMQQTIDLLFRRMALTARVPVDVIAEACVVFVDGLALQTREPESARLTFDVFWLAMLGLAE
ncbi:MAG: helix-turn-helix domain-containing protein [Gemmatimonadaceae bacterium]